MIGSSSQTTTVASVSDSGSILAPGNPARRPLAPRAAAHPRSVLTISAMTGLFSVLRHRDFRLLWLAGLASVLGDRIVTVALALFVIDLTGSATDLGFVLAAHAIPLVAFMLIGGIWADRVQRHRLMVVTDGVRFVLHATLAALILTGDVQIWQVVVIEARLRDRRGLLPARGHGRSPPDGPRGGDPGGQRAGLDVEQRLRVRRAGDRDRSSCSASAPARPSRSTPRRSSSARCCSSG